MKFSKHIGVSALIAATLTFTGCTQTEANLAVAAAAVGTVAVVAGSHSDGSNKSDYYHHDQNYGENRNYSYRRGVRDGCDSSRGTWRKDHERFKHDINYKDGWKSGKRRCR